MRAHIQVVNYIGLLPDQWLSGESHVQALLEDKKNDLGNKVVEITQSSMFRGKHLPKVKSMQVSSSDLFFCVGPTHAAGIVLCDIVFLAKRLHLEQSSMKQLRFGFVQNQMCFSFKGCSLEYRRQ